MSDRIIGTAVLEGDRLFVVHATKRNGWCDVSSIPVNAVGDGRNWKIVRRGETLDVSPSLRIPDCDQTDFSTNKPVPRDGGDLFHNDAAWSVPFVEVQPVEGDYRSGYRKCIDLNRELMAEWRTRNGK